MYEREVNAQVTPIVFVILQLLFIYYLFFLLYVCLLLLFIYYFCLSLGICRDCVFVGCHRRHHLYVSRHKYDSCVFVVPVSRMGFIRIRPELQGLER